MSERRIFMQSFMATLFSAGSPTYSNGASSLRQYRDVLPRTALRAGTMFFRIDRHRVHNRHVDHDAAVTDGLAGPAAATTAYCDQLLALTGKSHRQARSSGDRAAGNPTRPFVMHAVPYSADAVVFRTAWRQCGTRHMACPSSLIAAFSSSVSAPLIDTAAILVSASVATGVDRSRPKIPGYAAARLVASVVRQN